MTGHDDLLASFEERAEQINYMKAQDITPFTDWASILPDPPRIPPPIILVIGGGFAGAVVFNLALAAAFTMFAVTACVMAGVFGA